MSKVAGKRALYTLEFKQEAVRVVRSGRSFGMQSSMSRKPVFGFPNLLSH